MPQGVRRTELDLSDRTYDGSEESGQLLHGLGQLIDGAKGKDNFRLDIKGLGKGIDCCLFIAIRAAAYGYAVWKHFNN